MHKTQLKYTSPSHVAIIMDGNGRWAEAQGYPREFGHQAGAETVRRVTEWCRERGLPYLTLYAFSTENWSRPQPEVDALMQLLGEYLESELPTMLEHDIQLRIIGNPDRLSETLREQIAKVEAATADNRSLVLSIAINYGGRDEIARACRKAALTAITQGDTELAWLDEAAIGSCLDTAGMPDPDVIIRTAGEQRLSNFLIWQAAYAEFVFVETTWPAFSIDDFEKALEQFASRKRTFGGRDAEG